MFDPKFFDELAKRLSETIPDSVKSMRSDIERNFRAVLQTMFSKLDLVTREEFDVQAMVLSKTRAKLEKLEQQVDTLEKALSKSAKMGKTSTKKGNEKMTDA